MIHNSKFFGDQYISIKEMPKVADLVKWIEFKNKVFVSQLNFEETGRVGRPMFDLSYCMTEALNQVILITVQFDKNKFKITDKAN